MGYITRTILLAIALASGLGAVAGLTVYLATDRPAPCHCKSDCRCRNCRCCDACK